MNTVISPEIGNETRSAESFAAGMCADLHLGAPRLLSMGVTEGWNRSCCEGNGAFPVGTSMAPGSPRAPAGGSDCTRIAVVVAVMPQAVC